jgi:exonuclease III
VPLVSWQPYILYPDIICITETWLKKQIPDDVIQIHNYTLLRRDRKEREHGGVCLYIKIATLLASLMSQMNMNVKSCGL